MTVEIALTVSSGHERHHVRETGYLESPRRIGAIRRGFAGLPLRPLPTRAFPDRCLARVHSRRLVDFIRSSCAKVAEGRFEYPYMIPVRRPDRPPREWDLAIGYYCIDTFTPIHRYAYATAREAVDAALSAAEALRGGARYAYALVRPPGHHAERNHFGGFCYLNAAAVAADYLSRQGRVAMLDLDYHHGNGQQDVFWERADVLTISIHGHPRFAYPYFSGYRDEEGAGAGRGFNINLPLADRRTGAQYRAALKKAIGIVRDFDPDFVVVPLGFDVARNDPTGSFDLDPADFALNGKLVRDLRAPVLFVQEGGYEVKMLARNARAFFGALCV